jgi:hypothetical protein
MTQQPEALRLAKELDAYHTAAHHKQAAAELRRLHEANQAMLEALEEAATSLETIGRLSGKANYISDDGEKIQTFMQYPDEIRGYANSRAHVARAAIAKGEQA